MWAQLIRDADAVVRPTEIRGSILWVSSSVIHKWRPGRVPLELSGRARVRGFSPDRCGGGRVPVGCASASECLSDVLRRAVDRIRTPTWAWVDADLGCGYRLGPRSWTPIRFSGRRIRDRPADMKALGWNPGTRRRVSAFHGTGCACGANVAWAVGGRTMGAVPWPQVVAFTGDCRGKYGT